MKFEGCVDVETQIAKKACGNYKTTLEIVEQMIHNKIEEYKNTIVPYKIWGIRIPFCTQTKYDSFGFNGDIIDKWYARKFMMSSCIDELLEQRKEYLDTSPAIKRLLTSYDTDVQDNRQKYSKQIEALCKHDTQTITVNPAQSVFIANWKKV